MAAALGMICGRGLSGTWAWGLSGSACARAAVVLRTAAAARIPAANTDFTRETPFVAYLFQSNSGDTDWTQEVCGPL